MTIFRSALVAACLPCAIIALPASAQNSLTAPSFKTTSATGVPAKTKAAKPAGAPKGERRPGELEGFDSGIKGSATPRAKAPADVVGERRIPDGGLPLPEQRGGGPAQTPLGFDKSGNMGGMFKF